MNRHGQKRIYIYRQTQFREIYIFILHVLVAVMAMPQLLEITGFQWQASAITVIIIILSKTITGSTLV